MKRFTGVLALLLMLAVSALASTDKQAKQLYQKGKDAEARQDYITAYNFYHQAYQLKPTDLTYRSSYEYVRFLAAASYVHQGELLMNAGKLQEALTDFEQALAIDPSSFIAQQKSNKIRLMIKKSLNPTAAAAPSTETGLTRRMEEATGPVELAPISQTPITLKLTQDSKTVYESIGTAGRHQRSVRSRLHLAPHPRRPERRHPAARRWRSPRWSRRPSGGR